MPPAHWAELLVNVTFLRIGSLLRLLMPPPAPIRSVGAILLSKRTFVRIGLQYILFSMPPPERVTTLPVKVTFVKMGLLYPSFSIPPPSTAVLPVNVTFVSMG